MEMRVCSRLAMLLILLIPMGASAQEFDGTGPMLCASIDTLACGPGEDCVRSTADSGGSGS